MVGQLRGDFHLRNAQRSYERVEAFQRDLKAAAGNERLLDGLHQFNDWAQCELMGLTAELAAAFFGQQPEPASPETGPVGEASARAMSQSQSGGAGQRQSQSQG
jgi:hypothetical protein